MLTSNDCIVMHNGWAGYVISSNLLWSHHAHCDFSGLTTPPVLSTLQEESVSAVILHNYVVH